MEIDTDALRGDAAWAAQLERSHDRETEKRGSNARGFTNALMRFGREPMVRLVTSSQNTAAMQLMSG
jgi:hypothetical protein